MVVELAMIDAAVPALVTEMRLCLGYSAVEPGASKPAAYTFLAELADTLADRISLFDRIQGGSRLTADFIAMIGLSVLIASFGLMADNASVVIGAMLVAPFMTPLIGVGLALAQGNLALMKRSALI